MTAEDFRRIALSMSDARESAHHGHADFRAASGIFATLGYPDVAWGMVKLSPQEQAAFVADEPEVFRPVPGGWGRRGSTNVRLESADETALSRAISAAYAHVAWAKKQPGGRQARSRGDIMDTRQASGSIDRDLVAKENAKREKALTADYETLGEQLARRRIDIDAIARAVAKFAVAIPSWGVGTGGTRFARYPSGGEPRDVFDKLDDCAVIQQLVRSTPTVSLHIPWDKVKDLKGLKQKGEKLGLGFDAMNSNTFQDSGQKLTYKFGSLSHTDERIRDQAVAHNIECIEIGEKLGSKALTVWIGDGSNFPGQANFTRAFERYIDAMRKVYAALPGDWRIFIEHKLYEPAFYSTVIQDWGSSYLAATELGPKAFCLVDLGHHAPNVNIEMIVARLIQFKKLAGFHFNDSKYGDDDLDAGSINPYQLFLVFNELVDAAERKAKGFRPAYMIDQSHNVTDPIESLMTSAIEIGRAYAQALLVDRAALAGYQDGNDALMAAQTLKRAFTTDVSPILAKVRADTGGAIDPVAAYRASGYRAKVTRERPAAKGGGGGIV